MTPIATGNRTMTSERWQQIETLMQEALEQPTAERPAFVRLACADDAALLDEVEALLASYQVEDGFLEAPPAEVAAAIVAANPAEFSPGHKLDRYELQRVLGRGGMGTVYLAQDTQLGRQVALKLLPPAAVADTGNLRRFRQEARAVSALNHPNILTLHEIGEADETHFIATEYVAGQTLRDLLTNGGLTLGEALDVALQTASALAAAHETSIVHRDIKPENLMRRPDGLVKVLDFGIAKLARRKSNPKIGTEADTAFSTVHTNPGLIMGTVSYMSPEQARGLDVDARSDLFSLGVVLYEMLTGRAPFARATTGDVLVAILEREPPPLKSYAPALPVALQHIVSRAMAKDRDQRYQHASELLGELKELKQEFELAARLKRSGDTPARQASLSLRVGQAVPDSAANTGDAPTAITKPAFLHRFAQPLKLAAMTLLALTLMMTLALLIYRYWPTKRGERIQSIAVLPFVNASHDPQMEYLPDGLTENLMQSLQQLGLRVMARGTVFSYKGRDVDPRQVGQDLQVEAVITGRAERQGERLLISIELADATDGKLLWSEKYQRTITDLMTVQGDIARELSVKLGLRLTSDQQQQLAQRPTNNSEAYQLYLKGNHLYHQLTRASGEQALALFHQALALEPRMALAYCGIARVYVDFSSKYLPPHEANPKARQAALTALALDEGLAEAHFVLGLVKILDWDWEGAEPEYQRALAINPNLTDAMNYYVGLLNRQKRFAESLPLAQRVAELDPLSPQSSQLLGNVFHYSRQYDRALTEYL